MNKPSSRSLLITALIALSFGFCGAGLWALSGFGNAQTRDYLIENPEILLEVSEAYAAKQSSERMNEVKGDVFTPFPGAVLGNPNGSVTLVEFSDYACGYCRASHKDVVALIAANPDLKVVVREWSIFEGSADAALIALAAAQQGKFAAFHSAMFAAGSTSKGAIEQAAKQAGLDIDKTQTFLASGKGSDELERNMAIGQKLGFTGTPSWLVGDQMLEGAAGQEALQEAIDEARDL